MTGRYYIKCTLIVILILLFPDNSRSQSLVLRPYYGRKWYWNNSNNVTLNNTDPSYQYHNTTSRYITGIALELLYTKSSFELYFSSLPYTGKFHSEVPESSPLRIFLNSYTHIYSGDISQFQLLYNRYFFPKANNKKFKIVPVVTIGAGIGIVPPQSKLSNNDVEFYYGVGNHFYEMTGKSIQMAPINYSVVLKAGVSIQKNNREWLRIQAIANIGLNSFLRNEFRYAHTNDNYAIDYVSRGTFIGVQLSLPIYLKRFNKK
jgi:hypothetical protein